MSELWHLERKLHTARVLLWLRQSFVHQPTGPDQPEQSVCKEILFQAYLGMCRQTGTEPMFSRPVLGKMVKRAFPGIETRRRGPRTNVKQHWMCLRPRSERDIPPVDMNPQSTAIDDSDPLGSSPIFPSSTSTTPTSSSTLSPNKTPDHQSTAHVILSPFLPTSQPHVDGRERVRQLEEDRYHPFRFSHYPPPLPAPASAPQPYSSWPHQMMPQQLPDLYIPSLPPPSTHWHVNLEEPHHHLLRYDPPIPTPSSLENPATQSSPHRVATDNEQWQHQQPFQDGLSADYLPTDGYPRTTKPPSSGPNQQARVPPPWAGFRASDRPPPSSIAESDTSSRSPYSPLKLSAAPSTHSPAPSPGPPADGRRPRHRPNQRWGPSSDESNS